MFARLLRPGHIQPAFSAAVRNMSSEQAKKLAGKVAIVTASTDGIGLAIARRLGQDGARVMVSSRKQQNVDSAVQQLREERLEVAGTVCHVGKAEDRRNLIDKTVSQFGGVDILISNAAVNPVFGPILNTSAEAWDKIFEINVKAAFLLCQEVEPHMEKRGGGSIVLVSSIAAYQPLSALGAYSVSKTALLGLCKALAPELAHSRIRINVLAPGIIKTRFSEQLWKNESVGEMALQTVPMGRFGEAEECAGAASFLVSEDARYITGESLLVTGGMNARL